MDSRREIGNSPTLYGLIIHDLRRSAIKNLMKVGVNEKVAMKISGHKGLGLTAITSSIQKMSSTPCGGYRTVKI
jgi:hypothetical protein